MDATGMMRNLDQIQERDEGRESTRLVVIALGGLAAACVLFAAGVMIGRESEPVRAESREDPLARLDALANQMAREQTPEVTYPSRLVDTPTGGTQGASAGAFGAPSGANAVESGANTNAAPTAITARTASPVSASALVQPTGGVRFARPSAAVIPAAPRNQVRLATTEPAAASGVAPTGSDGEFTLQVSSFRAQSAAQTFATRLRERGHRAFVSDTEAGPGVRVWHRVRVGPFNSLREAQNYRREFESRERVPTFVVRRNDPHPH